MGNGGGFWQCKMRAKCLREGYSKRRMTEKVTLGNINYGVISRLRQRFAGL